LEPTRVLVALEGEARPSVRLRIGGA